MNITALLRKVLVIQDKNYFAKNQGKQVRWVGLVPELRELGTSGTIYL